MVDTWEYGLEVIDALSLLIVVPGYTFILVVNILDWMKNQRLDISDQLIAGITLVNLTHRVFQVICRYTVLKQEFHDSTFTRMCIYLMYLSLMFCTLLFSTLLAIHFCLKIVNINQNLYIYTQHKFPKMFPWILLPSFLASLVISGPAAQNMSKQSLNSTSGFLNPSCPPIKLCLSLKLYVGFSSFCFLIFMLAVVVTIASLYRHIHRLQSNTMRSETVEAHVRAVKTLLALIAFNLLYYNSVILLVYYDRVLWLKILYFLNALLHVLCFPILIRGSIKLQKMLHAMWLKCQ